MGSFQWAVGVAMCAIVAIAIGCSSDDHLWRKVELALARSSASTTAGDQVLVRNMALPEQNSRKPALNLISTAASSVDAVQDLRKCMLDKKTSTYNVASLITRSRTFAVCWLDECELVDMHIDACKLPVQAFGECFAPFNTITSSLLIEAEACSQRLQNLPLDKYIQKFGPSFAS